MYTCTLYDISVSYYMYMYVCVTHYYSSLCQSLC